MTVVLVTHFMEEAERLADRIAVIDAGKVVALDTPTGIVNQVDAEQRLRFRPSAPFDKSILTRLPEVRTVAQPDRPLVVAGTGNLVHAVTAVLARQRHRGQRPPHRAGGSRRCVHRVDGSPARELIGEPDVTHLAKITAVEARLLFREPGTWIIGLLLPAIVLLVIGLIFAPHTPDPALGGQRFIDLLAPSMVVISLATLGISTMPARLVKYRELGVLRRLSTTPVEPSALLVAQLLINVVVAIGGLIVVIVVGNLAFQIPLPQHLLGFVAAFLLGVSSLFAIGLLVAAVAPSSTVANALDLADLRGGHVPRRRLPAAVAAARGRGPDRRLHPARRPGHARRLARRATAAAAAGDNGGDHGRGRRGGSQAVPLGVSRLGMQQVSGSEEIDTRWERWGAASMEWCAYLVAGRLDRLRRVATRSSGRGASRHARAGRSSPRVGVRDVHPGAASPASSSAAG